MAPVFRALLLIGLVALPVTARAQVSCGDVLDRGIASLTADLDCTGSPGPAIILTKSVLKLSGFTIRGGTGIVCEDRCSVRGPGAVEDSAASGVWSNIPGRTKISLSGVEVRNNALWGVAGYVGPAESQSEVHVFKSLVEGNGLSGVFADRRAGVGGSTIRNNGIVNGGAGVEVGRGKATISRSTIQGNHGPGVIAFLDAAVAYSTVNGNEGAGVVGGDRCLDPDSRADVKLSTALGNESPTCAPGDCADVASCARPRVRRTTCGTSHRVASGSPGESWGTCALD